MLNHSHNTFILAFVAQLSLLALGCSAESASEEPLRGSSAIDETEASLEDALQRLDHDDLVITYQEGTSRMEMIVSTERFAQFARGLTIEFQVDLTLPDGTTQHHQLDWTGGETAEAPRVVLTSSELGLYEMIVTSVAIDGRLIPGAGQVRASMKLLSEASPAEELSILAPDEIEVTVGDCVVGSGYNGGPENNVYWANGRNNVLFGNGGDDVLYGLECKDVIYGGDGNDHLFGGQGADSIWGDGGIDDKCYGGDGFDLFSGCEQADQGPV